MLASIVAAVLAGATYFPLKPGLIWEYVVVVDNSAIRAKQVVKALEVTAIGSSQATPFEVWLDDKFDSKSYYSESGGFVKLVALSESQLLPESISVIPSSPQKGQKWQFSGKTMMFGQLVPTLTKSEIVGYTKTDVLGKSMDALKIETSAKIGAGAVLMDTKTTELYVKEIGLVYRRQVLLGKNPGGATTTLVRFDGGTP